MNYALFGFLSIIANICRGDGCTLCHLKMNFAGDIGDKPSAPSTFFTHFRILALLLGALRRDNTRQMINWPLHVIS